MNQETKSIWKKPFKGIQKLLAFLVVVVVVALIIIGFGLASGRPGQTGDLILTAFLMALISSVVVLLLFVFLRWLCCWRNFRRFLFGVACLATLIALFYAEEDWRGRRAWLRYRAESEAKGEQFDFEALEPSPVPDDKNFAMTPLLKPALEFRPGTNGVVWLDTNGLARLQGTRADLSPKRNTNDHLVLGSLEKGTFADLAACREFYRGNTNYPQPTTSGTPAEDILFALGKFAPELQELREATENRPLSRYPIQYDFEPSWGILLPHLSQMKGLTQLTHVHATAALEAGRSVEALADLQVGFRISDSIRDEPILIDHLVRIACLAIDLQTLREGLVRHAWSDAQLAEIEKHLGSMNLLAEYKHTMRGELVLSISGVDYLRRQGFRSNPYMYLSDEGGASSCEGFNFVPGGWFYQNMLTISKMHQDFTLAAVDENAHRVLPEVSENGALTLEKMKRGPYTIFAKLLLPALENATRRSARMQVYVDAARIACALERSRLADGKLPDTLEALSPRFMNSIPTDVIDGKPLRYRLNADGSYVLYSVGWNQTDDSGELVWKEGKTKGVDVTRGDWVWQMPGTQYKLTAQR